MRNAFISTLLNYDGDDLFLLTGDLGFSVLEKFQNKWPEQFINVGVAEQNMTGIAAGLAMEGYKVFTYSIANFNTIRCLEQIRNDICYNNLDVTIVSVGGGFQYGSAGYSHHAIQDIAIMGSLPNITLLLPNNNEEMKYCAEYALISKGSKYLRISKNYMDMSLLDKRTYRPINKIASGSSNALIASGGSLQIALKTAALCETEKQSVSVFSIPLYNKDCDEQIREELSFYKNVFVIEEHIPEFGLGAIISYVMKKDNVKVISIGIDRDKCLYVGDQKHLCQVHGLHPTAIADMVLKIVKE